MDFPILDLIDNESATEWLLHRFHPHGLTCPHCGSGVEEARPFRQTPTSQLTVYRCVVCDGIYNLYSSTVFQQKHLTPAQAVLLLRGVYHGESSAQIAREIGVSRPTVLYLRHALQNNAQAMQSNSPLADKQTETDEMFQNAEKKVTRISIHQTHPVAVPTSAKAVALMPMTGLRYLALWVERVVK